MVRGWQYVGDRHYPKDLSREYIAFTSERKMIIGLLSVKHAKKPFIPSTVTVKDCSGAEHEVFAWRFKPNEPMV